MPPQVRNVIIVGAGGNVGAPILKAITEAGFNVTILSRKSSKSTFDGHKVITIADDYPHEELVAAFKGQDAVVSTVTHLSTGGQSLLIDAAIEAGVYRFIPSEFGSITNSEVNLAICPAFEEKREVVKYLEQRQDQISWTGILTGPFFDWGLHRKFLDFDLVNRKAKVTAGGTNKFSTTTLQQVGLWVATVLEHAEATANHYIPVASFDVSQLELLAALEKATGDKWTVEEQSGEQLIKGSQDAIKAGNMFGNFGLIQAVCFVPGYDSSHLALASEWMSKFGVKHLDLDEEVAKVVKTL